MSLNGIDISHHQSATPPLAGLAFAFARATFGTVADDRYAQHTANFRKAGLVVGAYHFGTGSTAGATQAAAFLASAGQADLFCLDLERNGSGPTMTYAQARAFILSVQATGRKVGLYHSRSGFPGLLGQDFNWVADWSQAPSIPWNFWQYRGSPLDLDRFNGTLAQLRALAGKAPPVVPLRVSIHPKPGETYREFGLYTVSKASVITSARRARTGGFSAKCSAPKSYPWPGHKSQSLVRLLDGGLQGGYVRNLWVQP